MITSPALRTKITTVLFFILLGLILLTKLKTPFNFYDEGLVMISAVRVSQGEIPYRDFWGIYPPGQFYIIGAIFKLVDTSLLPARLYDTLTRFLLVVAVYQIIQKISSRPYAVFAASIIGLMLASIGFYAYPIFPAVALGLWALYAWINYTQGAPKYWLLISGILLGIAALIRWDVFLYTALSILIAAYLFLLLSDPSSPQNAASSPRAWRFSISALFAPLKLLAWLLIPMLSIALVAYGLLALSCGWENLFSQVFYFPTFMLRSVRWMAYPSLLPADFPPNDDWTRFYLPILTFGLVAVGLLFTFLKKRDSVDPNFFAILAMVLYGAFLFNQGLSRYDYIHVLPASILSFMVCLTFSRRILPFLQAHKIRYAIYLFIAFSTLLYFRPAVRDLYNSFKIFKPWGCYSELERAACIALNLDQQAAVQYIQSVTGPTDAIFVGNSKHDRIFVSDVGFYYLADRPVATRYQELHPGSANTLPVQEEIAGELESQQTPWIVVVEIWDSQEPNGSAVSTGVYKLNQYLAAHYHNVTSFGMYRILKRR